MESYICHMIRNSVPGSMAFLELRNKVELVEMGTEHVLLSYTNGQILLIDRF